GFDDMLMCSPQDRPGRVSPGRRAVSHQRDREGSGWDRRLALATGVDVTESSSHDRYGLEFNNTHFMKDEYDPHYGQATKEYALSERNLAKAGEPENWQQEPTVRTDQGFTVSAWLQPDQLDGKVRTAVSQKGSVNSSFFLGIRTTTVNGVTGPRFVLYAPQSNTAGAPGQIAASSEVLTDEDIAQWSHVVFVYDPQASQQIRLFVNGTLVAGATGTLWHADGPLVLGSVWHTPAGSTGAWVDQWHGGIDYVQAYQGAMSDKRVAVLHKAESQLRANAIG
ncbi:LamG domain-containing protein, partial [Actinoplanes sp. NPDC023936]|uniref:LamG domain-containing protein n=1 Tax=Actinoplanes sp. NPDC023936 TaxID=3154910 RepID=UPI0033DAD9B6